MYYASTLYGLEQVPRAEDPRLPIQAPIQNQKLGVMYYASTLYGLRQEPRPKGTRLPMLNQVAKPLSCPAAQLPSCCCYFTALLSTNHTVPVSGVIFDAGYSFLSVPRSSSTDLIILPLPSPETINTTLHAEFITGSVIVMRS